MMPHQNDREGQMGREWSWALSEEPSRGAGSSDRCTQKVPQAGARKTAAAQTLM